MGVKFEYLDVDDFLNENGLNEADVEFLDQLQKFENGSKQNENTSNQLMSASTPNSQTSSISPSPSSTSSHSSSTSSKSSTSMSNHSLKKLLDTPTSTGVNNQQQTPRPMNSGQELVFSNSSQIAARNKDTLNQSKL